LCALLYAGVHGCLYAQAHAQVRAASATLPLRGLAASRRPAATFIPLERWQIIT
jgi:hypothetical protein